jgi:hypothetical protein
MVTIGYTFGNDVGEKAYFAADRWSVVYVTESLIFLAAFVESMSAFGADSSIVKGF